MANTTDMMITTFIGESSSIEHINKETGLNFESIPTTACFEVYVARHRCIGEGRIAELIEVFKNTKFDVPEYVILFIDDDDYDGLSGVTIHEH